MFGEPFSGAAQGAGNWATLIDPRLKMIAVLAILIMLSTTLSAPPFLLLSALLGGVLFSLRPEGQLLRRWAKPTAVMLVITFLMHLLLADKQGSVLVVFFGLTITEPALIKGIYFCWRLVLFFMVALCFLLTITPDQFAQAIWRGLAPLRRIGVPSDDIGLMFFLVIRFIPEVFRQYRQIRLAQLARGASFAGSLPARIRGMAPLLAPVTVAAIRRSNTLADCLTVRGWGVAERRSYSGWRKPGTPDLLFALSLLFLIIVFLVL